MGRGSLTCRDTAPASRCPVLGGFLVLVIELEEPVTCFRCNPLIGWMISEYFHTLPRRERRQAGPGGVAQGGGDLHREVSGELPWEAGRADLISMALQSRGCHCVLAPVQQGTCHIHVTYMSHTCLQTRSAEGFRGTGSSCLRKETCTATFCRTKGPGDCRVISGQRDVAPEPCSPGCFQEPAAPPDGSVVSGPGSFASESTRGRPAVPGAALHSPLQQCVPALCSAVPTGAQ